MFDEFGWLFGPSATSTAAACKLALPPTCYEYLNLQLCQNSKQTIFAIKQATFQVQNCAFLPLILSALVFPQ